MSELNNVENLSNAWPEAQDNFARIESRLWNRPPSSVSGVATTLIGPPTSGAWVVNNLWWDANGAMFVCVDPGTPGTWVQITPALLDADPAAGTIPTGYRIVRTDLNFTEKQHEGGYVWSEVHPRRLSAVGTLDFASIAALASEDLTIAVAGAVVGDPVSLALPAAPDAGVLFTCWVSAADTVTVRATNITAGPINPASADYQVIVLKY